MFKGDRKLRYVIGFSEDLGVEDCQSENLARATVVVKKYSRLSEYKDNPIFRILKLFRGFLGNFRPV